MSRFAENVVYYLKTMCYNVKKARRQNVYDHLPVIDNPLDERTAYLMSPITLAFVGDAVYSLYVREKLVKSGEDKPAIYQKAAARAVSAVRGQAEETDKLIMLALRQMGSL